jgi:hypothetical protein
MPPAVVAADPDEVACHKSRPVKGNSYRLPYAKCLAARRSRTVIASRDDGRGESMDACVRQPQYLPDFSLALIDRTDAYYLCRHVLERYIVHWSKLLDSARELST